MIIFMKTETCLDCLEKNTKRLTQYPPCVNQNARAVYLIWDSSDMQASELVCNVQKMRAEYSRDDKLKEVLIQLVDISSKDAEKILDKAIHRYKNEVDNCVVKNGTGYFMTLNNAKVPAGALKNAVCERVHVIGDCIEVPDQMYDWEVNRDQAGAVWCLLVHAAFNDRILSSMYQTKGCKKILGWRDYSLARDEMLDYAVQLLEKQMQHTEKRIEEVYRDWRIEHLVDRIWTEKCMKPEWLPVIGYEMLKQKNTDKTGILKKLLPFFSRSETDNEKKIEMEDALGIFFGKVGTQSKPEWLREQISSGFVKEICKDIITDDLIRGLKNIFSIADLSGDVSVLVSGEAQVVYKKIEEAERKVKQALAVSYSLNGTKCSVNEAMDGFKVYFKQWENYMKLCIKAQCLNEMLQKLERIKKECSTIVTELTTELSRLNTRRVKGWSSIVLEGESRVIGRILSVEELKEQLNEFVSNSHYKQQDMETLQMNMAGQYTDRIQVSGKSHYHLFASQLICNHDVDQFYLGWELHRQGGCYLPENLFWELLVWEK